MQDKPETFTYTYSAEEQAEMRRIRSKYLPPEQTRLDRLRQLDRSATRRGRAVSILAGAAGALLLGVGMCCTMVWVQWFAAGIAVGLAGIALIAAALPLYNRITRRERQKLAPEILRLTADLEAPPDGRRA